MTAPGNNIALVVSELDVGKRQCFADCQQLDSVTFALFSGFIHLSQLTSCVLLASSVSIYRRRVEHTAMILSPILPPEFR